LPGEREFLPQPTRSRCACVEQAVAGGAAGFLGARRYPAPQVAADWMALQTAFHPQGDSDAALTALARWLGLRGGEPNRLREALLALDEWWLGREKGELRVAVSQLVGLGSSRPWLQHLADATQVLLRLVETANLAPQAPGAS